MTDRHSNEEISKGQAQGHISSSPNNSKANKSRGAQFSCIPSVELFMAMMTDHQNISEPPQHECPTGYKVSISNTFCLAFLVRIIFTLITLF